jgi:hypothetical protein
MRESRVGGPSPALYTWRHYLEALPLPVGRRTDVFGTLNRVQRTVPQSFDGLQAAAGSLAGIA